VLYLLLEHLHTTNTNRSTQVRDFCLRFTSSLYLRWNAKFLYFARITLDL